MLESVHCNVDISVLIQLWPEQKPSQDLTQLYWQKLGLSVSGFTVYAVYIGVFCNYLHHTECEFWCVAATCK